MSYSSPARGKPEDPCATGSGSDRPFITLDDVGTLNAARTDPIGFIRGVKRAVIDEVRRAPDLILAIKESVDRDDEPGRFLLMVSANLATVPAIADSLAGRMAVVSLLPFAQSEIRFTPDRLLDRLFAGEEPSAGEDAVIGDDLVAIVLRGGYPEALRRPTPGRRTGWLEDCVKLILDRDVRDSANIDQFGCSRSWQSTPGNWPITAVSVRRSACRASPRRNTLPSLSACF